MESGGGEWQFSTFYVGLGEYCLLMYSLLKTLQLEQAVQDMDY